MINSKQASTRKVRVAVLYGGRSTEHEVSIRSATNVVQNLDPNLFEVFPIGIDKQGCWFLGDTKQLAATQTLQLEQNVEKLLFTPHLIGKKVLAPKDQSLTGHTSTDRIFDVVFPVIHGNLCEDGTVQGLLELADIPYVGCGVLASSVGMDKDVSKRLIKQAGLKVVNYLVTTYGKWLKDPAAFAAAVAENLTYPVFVKPANTGSSVGVEKVKQPADLQQAIENAFRIDTKILVEQGIDCREIELSVLESTEYGAEPIVSIPGEIQPQNGHEFYSYASKYLDEEGAALIIPADVPDEVKSKLKTFAKNIFATLECEGMARVDLFLERGTNELYFNEINTIPGFTQISMYPKLLEATGVSYQALLTHLIQLAMDRHSRKSKLSRDYATAE